ncbi:MAG: hypothetical protein Q7U51_01170 [Methanoregula sp.]|nr:hypothetical protein [Methanoregula sp.]
MPRTGTSGKTPQKTRLTGRSRSAGSGQSGPGIDPDGHFWEYERDQVISGDQGHQISATNEEVVSFMLEVAEYMHTGESVEEWLKEKTGL